MAARGIPRSGRVFPALTLALALFGCGVSQQSPGTPGPGTPGPGTPGPGGGTLVVGNPANPSALDPAFTSLGTSQLVYNQIFEGLVTRDRTKPGVNPPMVGSLAESWDVSPDGRTYTFHLRSGVAFHDGTPFNADAVEFNFRRWIDPEFEFYDEVAAGVAAVTNQLIVSTRVVDELTYELTLKERNAGFLDRISAHTSNYFVSPAAIEEFGNEGQLAHGVGTGPFTVAEFVPNDLVRLVRNDDYWGTPAASRELIFRGIPDPGARVAALLTGEVDIIYEIPADDISALQGNPDVRVYLEGKPLTFSLQLMMREEPFANPKVREAVSLAVNRAAIAEDLLAGSATPATQLYGPGSTGFDESITESFPYDPERARQLLAEAGYPDGFETKMVCAPSGLGIGSTDQIMELVASDLGEIGIDVALENLETNTYFGVWIKGIPSGENIGAYCMGIGTDDAYLLDQYAYSGNHPPVGWVMGYYENPEVDSILEEAAGVESFDEYIAMHREAQRLLLQDDAYLMIVHDAGAYAVRSSVKDWVPARSWNQDLRQAWVDE